MFYIKITNYNFYRYNGSYTYFYSAEFILNNNASLGYRQPNKSYSIGDIAYHSNLPTGYYLECTTAGTTSVGDITPPSKIDNTVTDGTVVWMIRDINQIPDNIAAITDCNTAKKQGIYNVAANATDSPYSYGGKMVVFANNNLYYQIFFAILSTDTRWIYYRTLYGGVGWTPWQQQEAIVAKSITNTGYIKYVSGLIIQWGSIGNPNNITAMSITFPIAFSSPPVVVVVGKNSTSTYTAQKYNINTYGISSKTFYIAAEIAPKYLDYIAIGY